MKTALYIGAGIDMTPILLSDADRIIYIDERPMNDVNDNIMDDFIKLIRAYGFKVKINYISYIKPFYIKCFNKNKYIKYYFNTKIPSDEMLKYETIDILYIGNTKYSNEYIQEICGKYFSSNCQIMRTSYQLYLQQLQIHSA